jgi:hypothetical protein
MVDAKVQDHILELLGSGGSAVAEYTCWLVTELASHEPTAPAILELNLEYLLKQLLLLSR